MPEFIIHDGNWQQHVSPVIDGEQKSHGLVPRNYSTHPQGCYASIPALAIDFPLIDQSKFSEIIRDKIANGSQLSDIMKAKNVPCLDQNGKGYCWAHSTTGCVQAARAVMNEPTVELSAYAVACKIKDFRDEGGWGAESADFVSKNGVPSSQFWPQRSMDRANDNPNTWANAALHKITGQWADLSAAEYDRKLSFNQVCTLLLSAEPVVGDFNWWSHSVMLCDVVDGASYYRITRNEDTGKLATLAEFDIIWDMDGDTAGFGIRFRNSWGLSYGDQGFSILTGSKAIPDGAVGLRTVSPSPN